MPPNNNLDPSAVEIENLTNLYKNKDFEKTKGVASELTKRYPDFQLGWKIL